MKLESTINDIIQTLEDGKKGFASAADKADKDGRQDLALEFRQYSDQRARFSDELRNHAAARNVDIDAGPSVAGSLHRGWMAMKDALSGDDVSGVLDAAEQGEDHAVAEYAKAMDDDIDGDLRAVLGQQFTEIQATHDRVRNLRDSMN
ncbi:MAG: ferritin-like domain-containing protein [Ilumatobacteraceae bacterium]